MTSGSPPRGLASLALLKARFDAGEDHLGLFVPFVKDVVADFGSSGFTVADCKAAVDREHGLTIPQDALSPILARLANTGIVRREGGRFWPIAAEDDRSRLRELRETTEAEFIQLGEALRRRLSSHGEPTGTSADALAVLLAFLVDNDVVVLLEELDASSPLRSEALSRRVTRIVASFLKEDVLTSVALSAVLERLTRGLVLQDALLLRSTSQIDQRLDGLTIFLDSGFLLGLVGAKGEMARLAARESLGLLSAVGARIGAFYGTIDEMKRILAVYERHLATADGRLSLRATPLTHHFLAMKASPSDLRQLAASLELTVRNAGVVLRDFPKRETAHTLDEVDLERRLAGNREEREDARIRHDIDCVAAILQLRGGRDAIALERTNAVFATTSGMVVRLVSQWYREQGGKGIIPAMHLTALTNIAWLKKPAAAGKLQLHEVAALCESALQPSRALWDSFRRHLVALRNDSAITTDEAVAIVASDLAVSMMSELSLDIDPDASSILEVVDRVKAAYRAEADAQVQRHSEETSLVIVSKENEVARATGELHALRESVDSRTRRYSRGLANGACALLITLSIVSFLLGVPGVFDQVAVGTRVGAWTAFVISGGSQVYFGVTGGSPFALRDRLEAWLSPRIRRLQLDTSERAG